MTAAPVSAVLARLRVAELPATFTQEFLDRAVARMGAPYALFERDTPGFCVRVTAIGTGTYCFRSTVKGGASRTVKIDRVGSIPLKTARARALELKLQMQGGVDPRTMAKAEPVAEVVALQDLLDYWLANTTATPKTKDENERVIKQWLGAWLAKDISTISKKDVVHEYKRILAEVRKTGRPGIVTANRTMNAFRSVWNFWMDIVVKDGEELPCPTTRALKPKKRGGVRESTERVQCELTADAWRQWGREMRGLRPEHRAFCELHLFAGLRTNEVYRLRWSSVYDDGIYLPHPAVKNRKGHWIPWTPQLRAVVDGLRQRFIALREREPRDEFVFPSEHHRNGHFEAGKFVFAKFKVKCMDRGRGITRALVPYDCRRLFSSMAEALVSPSTLKALINHKPRDVTQGYVTVPAAEYKAAIATVDAKLVELLHWEK